MSQSEWVDALSAPVSAPQAVTAPQAPPLYIVNHQRDPPIFAGLRGEDVEDWLDNYERVSATNHWDDSNKLRRVSLYLTGVAKTWFLNHEIDLTDWPAFKQQLRQVFGTPAVRSALARRALDTRQQHPGESYTSYIEDVLALCRRVNSSMSESDKLRHILKGIGSIAYNALVAQNPSTVTDVVSTCQRLDELDSVRLQSGNSEHRTADRDLRDMIREIIREELQSMGISQPSPSVTQPSSMALRDIVREELTSFTGPAYVQPPPSSPPTYAQVAAAPPRNVNSTSPLPSFTPVAAAPPVHFRPIPPDPPSVHLSALSPGVPNALYYPPWRPSRPTCFYCGYRGHISRFCRKRQQDERRGYDMRERDFSRGDSYARSYSSGQQRSPSPPASTETRNTYRSSRRRSPSPFRRSSSPLRPASFTTDNRSEN